MLGLETMTHYELFEVSERATMEEVQRAYERLDALVGGDSLAGYTLVSERAARDIKARLLEAYQTLIDPIRRRDYDRQLRTSVAERPGPDRAAEAAERHVAMPAPAASGQAPSPPSEAGDRPAPTRPAPAPASSAAGATAPNPAPVLAVAPAAPVTPPPSHAAVAPVPEPIAIRPDTVFDGPMLRRVRESLGISINEIAEHTKIGKHHLASLEGEVWSDLPAEVYIKGFLRQYALYLGLDTQQVVRTYMVGHQRAQQ